MRIEAILQTNLCVGLSGNQLRTNLNRHMSKADDHSQVESSGASEQNGVETRGDECDVAVPHVKETVDPETRGEVLEQYGHRCQGCGRCGPGAGGLATLHVHHIERNPDGMDEHELENLSLLCRVCHGWLHLKHTTADSPVELTGDDEPVLLAQDIEILRFLENHGPARTGDIASGLSSKLSATALRERLWVLMGLDNLVETRDRQIVDKDVETGEWGLVDQIETSVRGHIPDDPKLLLQRMEDEQVRQAIGRGCDRSDIIDVFDVTRRTTFHKEKRAAAYDFPLDAFSRGGRPTNAERSQRDADAPGSTVEAENGEKQRDVGSEQGSGEVGRSETWGVSDAAPATRTLSERVSAAEHTVSETGGDDDEALRVRLQGVLDALQEVQDEL